MAEESFECPSCAGALRTGTRRCLSCGLRLSGSDAQRLWEVDQELARLGAERHRLLAALREPEGAGPRTSAPPRSAAGAGRVPRRSLSAQQLLLGLGALLLLAAVSFFLVVVWIVVGLLGQAAIMLLLTAAAATGARVAASRHLPAAAETGAVLTTGLLLIDAWAAHDLGLAGLDRVALDAYGAAVTPVLAVLLLLADRCVPASRSGRPVRPVLSYRPAAAAMAALTPWCLLSTISLDGNALVAGLAGVAVVDAGIAAAAHLWFRAPRIGAAEAPALLGCLVAAVGFLAGGLVIGYDPARSLPERWVAAALLGGGLVVPLLLVARGASDASAAAGRSWPRWLRISAVLAALLVGGILLMDAPVAVLVVLAVVVAGVGSARGSWAVAAVAGVSAAYAAVAALRLTDTTSLHALTRTGLPDVAPPVDSRDVAAMVLPALAGLALSAYASLRTSGPAWIGAGQIALLVTNVTALLASPSVAWTVAATVLAAAQIGWAAAIAVRHPRAASGSPTSVAETTALAAAAAYAVMAVTSAAAVSPERTAAVLVALGVVVLGYAACPHRLPFGYAGSLLVSAGIDTRLASADVHVIEASTLPLAALLAVMGLVQSRRESTLPTSLTAGPALSVALLPSTLTGITDGNAVRLGSVTALAVVALVVGLARLWRAPVTVGVLVLGMVALTQGGPLVAYVPGWVTMGMAGAVLLAVGVTWERAVFAGRRAHTWYDTLR